MVEHLKSSVQQYTQANDSSSINIAKLEIETTAKEKEDCPVVGSFSVISNQGWYGTVNDSDEKCEHHENANDNGSDLRYQLVIVMEILICRKCHPDRQTTFH